MHIVIVGAGRVGTSLSRHLIQERHDVSLIEANEERARHASNRLDCLVLQDEGNSMKTLEEAGISKADALVCVTESDEINMIICGLAATRYPKLVKIARVRNDEYIKLHRSGAAVVAPTGDPRILGIDHFIHPDVEAARSVLSAIDHGAMGDVLAFDGTPYELGSVDIAAGSPLDGLTLKNYRHLPTGESLVTLVEREQRSADAEGREETSELPTGDTVLYKGDRVHILARDAELGEVFKLAGQSGQALRRIGIVGGGQVGCLIAEGLLDPEKNRGEEPDPESPRKKSLLSFFKSIIPKSARRVTIIEQDYNICKDLSARFPEALILNEDISDESFVAEERLNDLDLIVTATNHQELNIVAAVYLKSRGVRRAIALVSSAGYSFIARQLGVEVVIPMSQVVVDSILTRLMGGGVKGVHRIGDGSIGIFELEVQPGAPLADKPITAFRLAGPGPGGLLLLANRNGESFIPRGDYEFKAGDHVIFSAKKGTEREVEKLFGLSLQGNSVL